MPGYHLRDIKRGQFGEASKITEEYDEFIESLEQKNPIMALVELSDLIGAIEGYASRHFNITLDDLIALKSATDRAFKSGHRTAKRG
jgi:hypothetical protein